MVFQLSPGINVSEIDLTTVVPGVGTTTGAFAGRFNWGPIEEIVTVSSEIELVDRFYTPDSNTFVSFFTAANFLAYAQNLKVVRATAATLRNAVANGTAALIKNEDHYLESFSSGANTRGAFAAKWAGTLGNSLKVSMFAGNDETEFGNWIYNGYFDSKPGTSEYVSNRSGANDEMHIVVVDALGKFSGTANTVLERFGYISKAEDAKNSDGSTNYYKDVLNKKSKYVWWLAHPDSGIGAANATNFGAQSTNTNFGLIDNDPYTITLSGGVDGAPSSANLITAFTKFKNPEEVDVSLIMTGDAEEAVTIDAINNIAEFRKDAIVFVSPASASVIDNDGSEMTDVIADRNALPSSSYAFMDNNWKYQFDKYNDTFRWIPLNGDVAGLCVRTDLQRDAWWSPAGFNRGHVKNVIRLAWNANKAERDELYKKGINTIITFPGEGTVLYGDKTLLSKPSAFDRINVRRLFIVLEKAIAKASQFSLFEFNDAFTRAQFVSLVEPFLRDVQGRRGIFDFRVVCDESNNTPEVIDRNEFVGDIYIKPARSINFIQLNFVAVRTGVSFDEIVGRF